MEDANGGFIELEVWKEARNLKRDVFELSKSFPIEERYRLSSQLVDAARSVSANIAEGHGRFTYKDQIHFCIQARGSLSETLNHLIDAFDCKYITKDQLAAFKIKTDRVGKLLNGYISYLRKKRDDGKL